MPEPQERGILDPISEGLGNMPLEITGSMTPSGINGHGVGLREWNFPRPEMISNFIPGAETEGDIRVGSPRFANRSIPVEVYVAESQGVSTGVNHIPNPSLEINTTGWSAISAATLARVLADGSGEYALDVLTTTTSGSGATSAVLITSIPSVSWVASAFVKAGAPSEVGKIVQIRLAEHTNVPALVGTTTATVTLTAEWQRVTVTRAFGATGNRAAVLITNNSAQVVDVLVDAIQLEPAALATPYYDGDTPGCFWSGTPHASTSGRRSSADRKRFLSAVHDLESKVEKLARSGGTLKRVMHDGTTQVFDVIEATFTADWNKTMAQGQNVFRFELLARPAARLAPIVFPLRTKPAATSILTATEGPVPGNFPALGRLEITDTASQDRRFLLAALQSDRLDSAATAAVQYLAKNLTPLSGAALANSPGTAGNTVGGLTNGVISATLTDGWAPYLSGKVNAGAYPTHRGSYRVWARVWSPVANTGTIQIRMEYSGSDLTRWVVNDPVQIPANTREGAWSLVDLGVARCEPPPTGAWGSSGAWRWEPRIAALSSVASDTLAIDTLDIFPVDEFYAESRPNPLPQSVSGGLVARGLGTAASSVLHGRTAELGGNWSTLGFTADFTATVNSAFRRPTVSDGEWLGRFARLGTGTAAGVKVEQRVMVGPDFIDARERVFLITRFADINNFAFAGLEWVNLDSTLGERYLAMVIGKRISGTTTILTIDGGLPFFTTNGTLGFTVLADGSTELTLKQGLAIRTVSQLPDHDLATSGVRATGGYGFYHEWNHTDGDLTDSIFYPPTVRTILTADSPPDLVLSSGRKAFLTNDRSLRQSADGAVVGEIGKYEGDRLLVPCSGQENKSVRWSVLDSRIDPDTGANSNLDVLTGQLTVIPRVTDVPEPQ